MKRYLLVYNPNAGNGIIISHLDEIIGSLAEAGVILIPYRLGGAMDLDRILEEFARGECSKIIVAGGDGTVNLVVSALIRNEINVPLAIFPTGTANDLAGYLKIPHTIGGMINTALADDHFRIDVGKAGGKYFVNVLAIGMLVDVSQRTDPLIKNTLGLGAYYLRTLAEVPFARANRVRIVSEECTLEEEVTAVLVMNGRDAGGFKSVAPLSDVGDGLLDVLVVRKLILPVMLPALLTVMMGQHMDDKRFEYFRTSKLRIEPVGGELINTDVDGERGDPLPLDIEVLPGRLRINTYCVGNTQ
jgi:YegS/Rv2252/BmrU family lipid kinase